MSRDPVMDILWYAILAALRLGVSPRLHRSLCGALAELARELERPNPMARS